jgi:hypothetical protein
VTQEKEAINPALMYRIRLIAIGFNLLIIVLYFATYNIVSYSLPKLLYALVGLGVLGLLTLRSFGGVSKLIHNLNLSLMGVLLCLCFIEVVIGFFPSLAPRQVRNFLAPSNMGEIRAATVEFLDQSPYVKFKANTVLRSQGFRGTDEQFAYTWKTDKNGFKNLPEITQLGEYDIVAVGDSFIEGMGVTIEKTWANVLNTLGYRTYNLGVQGYAPTQSLGSLQQYGVSLKPRYVIVGYSATTFDREAAYINLENSKKKKYTGGIQSIVQQEEREIRHRARYVVSAAFLLFQKSINDYRKKPVDLGDHVLNKRYAAELALVGNQPALAEAIRSRSQIWMRALDAFASIKTLADSVQAKTILLYFPLRGQVYYEKVTGKPIPEQDLVSLERDALRAFCASNEIIFFDLTPNIVDYVNGLQDGTSIKDYPYLEIDGHLNVLGNRLVAQFVADQLATLK